MRDSIKSFAVDWLSAGMAASIAKTIIAPLERAKVILQVQKSSQQIGTTLRTPYKGILDILFRIPKEQGFLGLWRGNFSNICRYFPTQAFNFSFYDKYKKIFLDGISREQFWKYLGGNLAAGGAAGGTTHCIVYPLLLCQTRITADVGGRHNVNREFMGFRDCYTLINRMDGIRGLYRGFPISVSGILFYRSFYFGIYETGKNELRAFYLSSHPPLILSLGVAQVAASFSGFLAYPMDTVSRRLMMDSGRQFSERKFKGFTDCLRKIYNGEGISGFYKGAFTNILRSTGGALVLVMYDKIHVFLSTNDVG